MAELSEDSEVASVALAALVKMVGLLCAELTVGSHRDDIDLIESCVRAKLHASVAGVSAASTAAGVALAHRLIEPVLRDVRERAEKQRARPASDTQDAAAEMPAGRLN
jgi:hypothetical protein